ncbi:hypothetical protein [Fictibacillus halophilus]|uniref:hypothetical protein n=1 Tax=Fictibacillus halophilus TaxID=1610490 RepID=UPI001CFB399C|nr:hypothetical protein [Fictibacillus halophilus]
MVELIALIVIVLLFLMVRFFLYSHIFKKAGKKKPHKKAIMVIMLVGIAKVLFEIIF